MAAKAEYSATTRQIWVSVNPIYLDDRSAPEHNHFVWAYHVVIEIVAPRSCNCGAGTGASRTRTENYARFTARALSANSLILSPVTRLNTRVVRRSRRRPASCRVAIRCKASMVIASMSRFRLLP